MIPSLRGNQINRHTGEVFFYALQKILRACVDSTIYDGTLSQRRKMTDEQVEMSFDLLSSSEYDQMSRHSLCD